MRKGMKALWLIVAPLTAAAASDATLQEVVVTGRRVSLELERPTSTASRLGLTVLETPASIQVLSGDLIRERGDMSIQDAVSRIVGVTDQATSGNGGGSVSARGFNGVNSVMRLYDGLQMFVVAGTMTFPSDPWTVDRIEVLGGPSSVMYGTGAIGGVVNVIPRKPNREVAEQSYRLTTGSYDTYRAAFDTTAPISERAAYRLSASGMKSDGWADRAESSSWAVSASIQFDLTENLRLTLSEDYGDQKPAVNTALPIINGRFDRSMRRINYNVLDAENRYEDSWTQAKLEWTPSEQFSLRSNVYRLAADRRWFGAGGITYRPATGLIERAGGSDLTHDLEQFGNVTTAVLKNTILGRENTASIGFDYNKLSFKHVYWISQATRMLDPYEPNVGYFSYLPGAYSYRNLFHAEQYSVFAEDNFEVTPRLSVAAGARLDRYDVDRYERMTGIGSEADFDPFSWRVGVLYKLRPNFTAYASYSTATDPGGSVGNMTAAAQRMKLMSGEQIEVGTKHSFAGGRGEWTAAVFRIVKNDLQVPVPDEPGVTQQVGQQSSQGIELAAAFNLGYGLRVEANATTLDAEFEDFAESVGNAYVQRDGNTPPNVPEETANLWLTWNFLPGWEVRSGLRYVGEQQADNANSRQVDSYTVVDGGLRWAMNTKSTLDLRIYNATDLYYAPRGSNATSQRAAAPRTAEVSWSLAF
jgi:iron complex outermembrane receptor protein